LNLGSRQRLRPIFDVAIPGGYAWIVTVAWPVMGQKAVPWARTFAVVALLALAAAATLVGSRHRQWSAVAVGAFVTASAMVWLLVGSDAPTLGLLGSIGWAAFAIGWVRASGTRELGTEPPAVALELAPRRVIAWPARVVLLVGVLGAAVPSFLAWRIDGRERALLGHAVALLAALQTLSMVSGMTLTLGQDTESPRVSWPLGFRCLVLAGLVAVGTWLTFS
jgi:hypothetical protein